MKAPDRGRIGAELLAMGVPAKDVTEELVTKFCDLNHRARKAALADLRRSVAKALRKFGRAGA